MDKILRNTNIWDLHIHTPLGTPTKKNYGNASTEEFIDTIIDIYNKSNNTGANREISRQIGNAVPPKISYFLAMVINEIERY